MKTHAYINPRNGEPVCARFVDDISRWEPYRAAHKPDCKWCQFPKQVERILRARKKGRKG